MERDNLYNSSGDFYGLERKVETIEITLKKLSEDIELLKMQREIDKSILESIQKTLSKV